jgi:hypothetical protein
MDESEDNDIVWRCKCAPVDGREAPEVEEAGAAGVRLEAHHEVVVAIVREALQYLTKDGRRVSIAAASFIQMH